MTPEQAREKLIDREAFEALVAKGPQDHCWPWLGTKNATGYGDFKGKKATHLSLILAGLERPSPRHGALHSCDNPPCVNPAHLRWGTQKENMADASRRGRIQSSNPFCPKGHLYSAENTIIVVTRTGWRERHCRTCKLAWMNEYRRKKRLERAHASEEKK